MKYKIYVYSHKRPDGYMSEANMVCDGYFEQIGIADVYEKKSENIARKHAIIELKKQIEKEIVELKSLIKRIDKNVDKNNIPEEF